MKRFVLLLLLLPLIISLLPSCETDFEVNADYKEIMVVYGLLDHGDTTHYIRIGKAFLGEESALVMATDPDNATYPDILDVSVQEWANGQLSKTWMLNRITLSTKEPGIFYWPEQVVYSFDAALNKNNLYKLIIKNRETGATVSAQTRLVGDISIEKPVYNPLKPQISFVNQSGNYTDGECKWISAPDGRLYELTFRFHYREVAPATPSDTTDHFTDWRLTSVRSSTLEGDEPLMVSYNGESFYKILQANIPQKPGVIRLIGNVDLIISVGGDELSTYIDLNRPSNSLIQERPSYTNISNGIGIFSCRHTVTLGFALSQFSVSKLLNSDYTAPLNFQ